MRQLAVGLPFLVVQVRLYESIDHVSNPPEAAFDMENVNNPDVAHNSRRATNLDAVIGSRLRLARINAGLSQTTVAERLGITFQQIQKYEKGSNRISASTLHSISAIFGLPITFFFQDIEKSAAAPNLTLRKAEFALTKRGQRLLEFFQSASPKVQASIIVLLTAVAGGSDDEDLELDEQLDE